VQAEAEAEAGEEEVVAFPRAQAAQEEEKCGRDEKRIERKTQTDAADDVWPGGDAREQHGKQTRAAVGDLFAEQVDERQCEKSEQGRADLETLKGEAGAKDGGDEDRPIELDGFAACVAREEDARLALRDVVHVEDLFGVVAERLGGDGTEAVEAEECRDEEEGKKKRKPIRYTDPSADYADVTDFFMKCKSVFFREIRVIRVIRVRVLILDPKGAQEKRDACQPERKIQDGKSVLPKQIERRAEQGKRGEEGEETG